MTNNQNQPETLKTPPAAMSSRSRHGSFISPPRRRSSSGSRRVGNPEQVSGLNAALPTLYPVNDDNDLLGFINGGEFTDYTDFTDQPGFEEPQQYQQAQEYAYPDIFEGADGAVRGPYFNLETVDLSENYIDPTLTQQHDSQAVDLLERNSLVSIPRDVVQQPSDGGLQQNAFMTPGHFVQPDIADQKLAHSYSFQPGFEYQQRGFPLQPNSPSQEIPFYPQPDVGHQRQGFDVQPDAMFQPFPYYPPHIKGQEPRHHAQVPNAYSHPFPYQAKQVQQHAPYSYTNMPWPHAVAPAATRYQPIPNPSRKRGRSPSFDAGDSYGPAKKIRKQSLNQASQSYSDISRGTSDLPSTERKQLRASRRSTQRKPVAEDYGLEKPKSCPDAPWVRTNVTTQGLSSRTAKINNYKGQYEQRPHPLGSGWQGTKFKHEYTNRGEFAKDTMTAQQIEEFIVEYPKKAGARLKLWLQINPTDGARRYLSPKHSKCRFKMCPLRCETRSIKHGHYRISFDEKWYRDRENADPFGVTGFVHLYCMERLLDFQNICQIADVEVDTRHMSSEPRGRFAGTLSSQAECGIAQDFIERARRGKLHELQEFADYPEHRNYKGEEKTYENTLTYHMVAKKFSRRPKAQMRQFLERDQTPAQLHLNYGNLQIMADYRIHLQDQAKVERKKKRLQKTGKPVPPDYDDNDYRFPTEVLERIQAIQEKFGNSAANARSKKKSRRRDAVDSDDETEIEVRPKKSRRVVEAESEDESEDQFDGDQSDDEDEDEVEEVAGPTTHEAPSRTSERIRKQASQPDYREPDDNIISAPFEQEPPPQKQRPGPRIEPEHGPRYRPAQSLPQPQEVEPVQQDDEVEEVDDIPPFTDMNEEDLLALTEWNNRPASLRRRYSNITAASLSPILRRRRSSMKSPSQLSVRDSPRAHPHRKVSFSAMDGVVEFDEDKPVRRVSKRLRKKDSS